MAFLDNIKTPVVSTDVGVKLSKPGYDARSTGGQNMVFDSSWPSLPVVFQLTIPNSTALSSYTFINGTYQIPHGLKFPPLAFYWQPTPTGGISGAMLRDVASVDDNYIYVAAPFNSASAGTTAPVHIKAFNIDLRVDADYTLPPSNTFKSTYDPNFGFKVVKSGKSISSTDLRDYIVHSRAQSPLILAVKTEKTTNPANPQVVQYTTGLSYQTWVYGFARSIVGGASPTNGPNFYLRAGYFSQSFPITVTNGFTSSLNFSTLATGATIVVLRDPMTSPTQITVQY